MYDKVVTCIKKPSHLRTDEETEDLVPFFAKKNQLFESMKPEVIKDIIKNCVFSERRRDNVIIRQGERGNCFYIILSGKVSIYINTDAVPDDPEETQDLLSNNEEDESNNKKSHESVKELDRSKYGNYIAPMNAGKGFGELALINKDCVRNASIIADELTHLVEIDRDLYNRSLRAAQEADFRQRIDFVNGNHLFGHWLARYKRQVAMSLRKEQLLYDMPIARQGDPVNGLIFVLKGQAKIIVNIHQHVVQYPQLNLKENSEDMVETKEHIGEFFNLNDATENKIEGKQKLWEKPLCRQGYVVAEQRQIQKHIEISIIGSGELIGDIEHGMDLSTYAQTVICTQTTDCYILDAKNFERLVHNKRNVGTMAILQQKAQLKLLSRVARSLGKQVPLIRMLVHRIEEQHHNEELQRQQKHHDFVALKALNYQGTNTSSFIPERGPLIDQFGPGTVFHRNRLQRVKKQALIRAKQKQQSIMVNRVAIVDTTNSMILEKESILLPPDPSLIYEEEIRLSREAASKFADWETSSVYLESVEERLSNWFQATKKFSKPPQITSFLQAATRQIIPDPQIKLRRFKKKDLVKVFEGSKIVLRPRQPANRTVQFEVKDNPLAASFEAPTSSNNNYYSGPEDDGIGYQSGDEVFITAQSPMRLGSSRTTTAATAKSRDKRDESGVNLRSRHQKARSNFARSSITPSPNSINCATVRDSKDQSGVGISDDFMVPISVDKAMEKEGELRNSSDLLIRRKTKTKSNNSQKGSSRRKSENGRKKNSIQDYPLKQYTVEDYRELKALLKKKEIEMSIFRITIG